MSGFAVAIAGPGSALAVNMAADGLGRKVGNRPIEIASADHRNKTDLGSAVARSRARPAAMEIFSRPLRFIRRRRRWTV